MKLLFIIPTLHGGGAERVLATIVNELVLDKKYDVYLLVHSNTPSSYVISSEVHLIHRRIYSGSNKFVRYYQNCMSQRRIIKELQPDIIIPFMTTTTINTFISSWGLKIPLIASEHRVFSLSLGSGYNILKKIIYKRLAHIICLTKADYKDITLLNRNVSIIYNPYYGRSLDNVPRETNKAIIVGSLDRYKIKGIDKLIIAWVKMKKLCPELSLHILGTGSKENVDYLNSLINSKNLNECVYLEGFQSNISEWYQKATLCIVASKMESFSMAIIEAQSRGCPVISFNCPNGPGELINNGVNGLLVENQNFDILIDTVFELYNNPKLLKSISEQSIDDSNKFSLDNIISKWKAVFTDVAYGK